MCRYACDSMRVSVCMEYVCACESVYEYFAMLFNLCVILYISVYALHVSWYQSEGTYALV